MQKYEEFKTADIVLAAFLRVSGCQMTCIEKQGLKGTFVFEDVSGDLVADYDLGKALVNPIDFNNAIKALTTSVRRTN